MTDESADMQVMEKLVEALMKIAGTMDDICKVQTAIAELLKDVHAEQRDMRDAMEQFRQQMVQLTAMIEGRAGGNFRPN